MNTKNQPMVETQMLIRKPATNVFQAFIDPAVTTNFWFTKSSGKLKEEKTVTWTQGQFDVSAEITVTEIKKNKLIRFQWPSGEEESAFRTVELSFEPKSDDTTYVRAVETGFDEDDPQLIEQIAGQTEGWSLVLSALKAWLEYDINLNLISDHHPSE